MRDSKLQENATRNPCHQVSAICVRCRYSSGLFCKPGFTIRTAIHSGGDHGRALRAGADHVQGRKQPDPEPSQGRAVRGQNHSADNRVGKQPPGRGRYYEYHEGKRTDQSNQMSISAVLHFFTGMAGEVCFAGSSPDFVLDEGGMYF